MRGQTPAIAGICPHAKITRDNVGCMMTKRRMTRDSSNDLPVVPTLPGREQAELALGLEPPRYPASTCLGVRVAETKHVY